MPPTFTRTRFTWFAYALWTFFGFFINALGPLTPFLKAELNLSYTVSSLHFTAFAAGILLTGVGGQWLVERVGRRAALWLSAGGISASMWLLLLGQSPFITIGAAGLLGVLGGLIFISLPAMFSDQYGALRAIPLSESNLLASIVGMCAPLLIGWAAAGWGGWRLAVGAVTLVPLVIYAAFRTVELPTPTAPHAEATATPLPFTYWLYWVAIFLVVAVEFCILSWSVDYLQHALGLAPATAAQAASLFLGGMIVGRAAGSRLVQRFAPRALVYLSLLLAAVGFGLFWLGGNMWLALSVFVNRKGVLPQLT